VAIIKLSSFEQPLALMWPSRTWNYIKQWFGSKLPAKQGGSLIISFTCAIVFKASSLYLENQVWLYLPWYGKVNGKKHWRFVLTIFLGSLW